jgi:iron only hydrogenase large subunit-like protein/nitrogen-specific signal transduction histidine kinase
MNGQAVVLTERCIACGHCVKVCSQNAKIITTHIPFVENKINEKAKMIAVVAPSFAASFPHNYSKFTTGLRELGFEKVIETSFGADLISNLYIDDLKKNNGGTIISSSCPAVCGFIQKYFVELVPKLAKIVSPMVAIGRYIKANLGEEYYIVFIGPCIAKKDEFQDEEVKNSLDAVLTFDEIKELFEEYNIHLDNLEPSPFDPPHAYMGKLYPLAGGLLKTTNLPDDLLEKEIIVVEGKNKVVEIIEELSQNKINARFVDILFCEGCISGPAIDTDMNYYSRRAKVVEYINESINHTDKQVWKSDVYNSRNLNLRRNFTPKNQRRSVPDEITINKFLAETNKLSESEQLNCGACGYASCREFAISIGKGLAEKEMCLPYLIDELQTAYEHLKTTQEQLHNAEKLASIGQLAAGVAHEINNPLGTIMLYTSLIDKEISNISNGQNPVKDDLELILNEAKRCKNIVANLLNFARQGKLSITKTDLSSILKKLIKIISMNPNYSDIEMKFSDELLHEFIDADKEQLEQVFSNVIGNACEAMLLSQEKKLKIRLYEQSNMVVIDFQDTGCGIADEFRSKVFSPFFTTKEMGKGTGLGLAISYGIIKMHRGEIYFNSISGKGTTFTIKLPFNLSLSSNQFN